VTSSPPPTPVLNLESIVNFTVVRTNASATSSTLAKASDDSSFVVFPSAASFAVNDGQRLPVVEIRQGQLSSSSIPSTMRVVSNVLAIVLDPPVPIVKTVVVRIKVVPPSMISSNRRLLQSQQQQQVIMPDNAL
jgi:hypothetical protein